MTTLEKIRFIVTAPFVFCIGWPCFMLLYVLAWAHVGKNEADELWENWTN